MTILIAHRGLLHGPDFEKENTVQQIELARQLGFDVEIDVWYVNDQWWLGHDSPVHQISMDWLTQIDRSPGDPCHHAWIHAKNIDALFWLRNLSWPGHYFYHQNDDVVITNTGYLWTYPGKQLTQFSIGVMPEWNGLGAPLLHTGPAGWCSDYPEFIKDFLSSK